jgi:hypothetical protein
VEPTYATGSTSVSIRVANGSLDYENPNQRKFILLVSTYIPAIYKKMAIYFHQYSSNVVMYNSKSSPCNRPPRAQRGRRGIALLILDLSARRGWVVSTTPRPLYLWDKPGTHCTGGWVGPSAGLDVCEKSRPHWDSNPGPSSP